MEPDLELLQLREALRELALDCVADMDWDGEATLSLTTEHVNRLCRLAGFGGMDGAMRALNTETDVYLQLTDAQIAELRAVIAGPDAKLLVPLEDFPAWYQELEDLQRAEAMRQATRVDWKGWRER